MSAMDVVPRVTKRVSQIPLGDLIDDFAAGSIVIPPHQRDYCWKNIKGREQNFILSILRGFPIPSILMSQGRDDRYPTIEDGRQRLTAARRFIEGEFTINWGTNPTTTYADLSADDKRIFRSEDITVQTFRGASPADRIRIFDWSQNGAPLSVGERLHAQFETPLVSLVKEALMTPMPDPTDPDYHDVLPGSRLHDRAANTWGRRGDVLNPEPHVHSKDKRRNWLRNATALISGLVHGPKWATKKYEPDLIVKPISAERKAAVMADLVRILEIYERAAEIETPTKRNGSNNKHFDLGTYTGCILFSLSSKARYAHDRRQEPLAEHMRVSYDDVYAPNSLAGDEDEWELIKSTWVDYIVEVRRRLNANPSKTFNSVLEEKIHMDASKARSWTTARWENGYKRIFGLVVEEHNAEEEEEEYEEEDVSTGSSDVE
jgi:hypothetical protein